MNYACAEGLDPVYGNDFAAGIDLRAAETIALRYGVLTSVGTGVKVEIPRDHVGLVRGRSGLAFRKGIWAFEGTIDQDYRGEINIQLLSFAPFPCNSVIIERGDRIAQLVIVPVLRVALTSVENLNLFPAGRGEEGFGSTGVK